MIDNIALLGSGLNTDDDITTIPNGDSRNRFNVVYGSDGDYGSLVGIKDSVSVPLLPEWDAWTNKACIGAVEYIHGNSFIFLLYGETTNLATITKHVVIGEVKSNNSVEVIGNLPASMLSKYTTNTTIEPYIIDKFLGFTDKINEPILINIERAKLHVKHNPVPYYGENVSYYNTNDYAYDKGFGLYQYIGGSQFDARNNLQDHLDVWVFIGDMYESFIYEDIIRYRKPPLRPPVLKQISSSGINLLNNNVFQFAFQYTYKDNQRSVVSPYSELYYGGTGYRLIEISDENLYSSEVKRVNIFARINKGTWFLYDSVAKVSTEHKYLFDNSLLGKNIDLNDFNRPFDYISSLVDESTVIGNRIVDGGIHEGNSLPSVNFELGYKAHQVARINKPVTENVITVVQNANRDFVNISITKPQGATDSIMGGDYISIHFKNTPHKEGDPFYFAMFLYVTKDGDTISSIIDYINKYNPIVAYSDGLGYSKPRLSAGIDTQNPNGILLECSVINSTGASVNSSLSIYGSAYNNFYMHSVGENVFKSVKMGSTVTVGLELIDKNGVFSPITNTKAIRIPSYLELVSNSEISSGYATWIDINVKVTSILPSWAVGYRVVYVGSDYEKFVQFPSIINLEQLDINDGYDITDPFYLNRLESLSVENKLFAPKIDYNSIFNIWNNQSNKVNFRPRVIINKYEYSTFGSSISTFNFIYGEGVNTDPANKSFITEFINIKKRSTLGGYSTSDTFFDTNTVHDTGIHNCYVRDVYNGDNFKNSKYSFYGAYEDMFYRDNIESYIGDYGRFNSFVDDPQKVYLTGKLRNGGNYIDNTQINNLCRFDVLDYNSVDDQWGKITQMYPVGQNLRVRQERNYSTVYIGSIQSVSPDGTTQTLQSSKFLGAVYAADAGIGSKYGGYYTIGTQEFTFDDATKNIYRTSQGGIYSISGKAFTQEGANDYKIHKLITDISLNNATRHINFGYDNENDLLLATFIGKENKTIGFHIPTQRWLSFYGFTPERYISSGINNYYFSGGNLFQMNKGLRIPIEYDFTTNVEPTTPKKFRSMAIVGDIANFICECTIPSGSNYRDMYTRTSKTVSKENKKYIEIPRNMKTSSNTPSVMEKETGIEMRGYAMNIKMTGDLKLTSINVNAD